MYIRGIETSALATIVAGLVKEGLTFEATRGEYPGEWDIELTGGY